MICSNCTLETFAAKDGLCRSCRLRAHAVKTRKYAWTPEMDAQLAKVYRTAKNKTQLTAAIGDLTRRLNRPRYIIWNRATLLGLRISVRRDWSADEIAALREHSGEISITDLAVRLGRTYTAVKHKLFSLGMEGRVTEGYSQRELRDLFGVPHATMSRWIDRGWLLMEGERVTHSSVERFVWEHMEEYRFASCEEWWLKTMLKPTIGRVVTRKPAQPEMRRIA